MNDQLKKALEELQSSGRRVNIFFLDDDVDQDEESLERLFDLFIMEQVPVSLAVVPGLLTEKAITLLQQYSSPLFELNQHGWRHINHEGAGKKFEFGSSRSFEQQLDDIAKGRNRMNEIFGDNWSKVFTPPWNRCTEETFRVLDHLGFEAISKNRGRRPITGYKFREISITLDLYRWHERPSMKSPEKIIDKLVVQMKHLDTIGIILYHRVMDVTAFSMLERLIETLRSYSCIHFHTFQSLLRADRAVRLVSPR
jgi:peptidoglycan/xylan/chitin deacetylase (PgdA/CDA1 family)